MFLSVHDFGCDSSVLVFCLCWWFVCVVLFAAAVVVVLCVVVCVCAPCVCVLRVFPVMLFCVYGCMCLLGGGFFFLMFVGVMRCYCVLFMCNLNWSFLCVFWFDRFPVCLGVCYCCCLWFLCCFCV